MNEEEMYGPEPQEGSSWFGEEQEMDETTAKEFEDLVDKVFLMRQDLEAEDKALKEKKQELERLKQKVMAFLTQFGKNKHVGRLGGVHITSRLSVKTPKSPEDREAFFEYLRSKGVFEEMLSVNSRTLQKFYKDEMEAALEDGDVDFTMPGIGAPTFTETLTMKKEKK